jgi:hypothetical protein
MKPGKFQIDRVRAILRALGEASESRILLANSKSSNFNDFQSGYPGGATKASFENKLTI